MLSCHEILDVRITSHNQIVWLQVRGATAHFDAVVSAATSGVLNAGLDAGVPVIFCVMTTDTMEQVCDQMATKVEAYTMWL